MSSDRLTEMSTDAPTSSRKGEENKAIVDRWLTNFWGKNYNPVIVDELEDKVEEQPASFTRDRISELRHDLLHIRRTLAPMRDAVRRVVDDVVELEEGGEVFPQIVKATLT